MWWIFLAPIWIGCGLMLSRILYLDWVVDFPGSYQDHWERIGWTYALSVLFPPLMAIVVPFATMGRWRKIWDLIRKDMKPAFEYMGEWFKDHIDWKW